MPTNESDPCLTSKDGVLLILPYWPRLYTRLSNDTDRRVREATQKAHFVGKSMNKKKKTHTLFMFKSERRGTFTLFWNTFPDLPIIWLLRIVFDVNNQIHTT